MNAAEAAAFVGISAERARAALIYDPDTGVFSWRIKPRRVSNNRMVGTVDGGGYLRIAIDGRRYLAHRLAVLIMTGEWPANEVDHVNGVRLDNRWTNLRQATTAQNRQNRPGMPKSASGLKGAHLVKATGKWRSLIRASGRTHYLGTFETAEEAHRAYSEAAVRLHGEFRRTV